MRPVLFTLGPLTLSSYPGMICLGACVAIWLTLREIERLSLNRRPYLIICLIGFSSGILGRLGCFLNGCLPVQPVLDCTGGVFDRRAVPQSDPPERQHAVLWAAGRAAAGASASAKKTKDGFPEGQ